MANTKKPTHVVTHGRLYMMQNGKLEHVEKGTELTLTANQAESLVAQGKVEKFSKKKSIDMTSDSASAEE